MGLCCVHSEMSYCYRKVQLGDVITSGCEAEAVLQRNPVVVK